MFEDQAVMGFSGCANQLEDGCHSQKEKGWQTELQWQGTWEKDSHERQCS